MSKCSYCGKEAYGSGCLYSPTGKHVHEDDEDACIYCGRDRYGHDCLYSPYPNHIHVHGHGDSCIYCGKKGVRGAGCLFSPDGTHRY